MGYRPPLFSQGDIYHADNYERTHFIWLQTVVILPFQLKKAKEKQKEEAFYTEGPGENQNLLDVLGLIL